jgi:hypothetical protein
VHCAFGKLSKSIVPSLILDDYRFILDSHGRVALGDGSATVPASISEKTIADYLH